MSSFGACDEPSFVQTVCEVCGANLYAVNMGPHLAWHEANDRTKP